MGFKKTTEGRVFFQRSNHGVDTLGSEERQDMFTIKDVESYQKDVDPYEDTLEHIHRSPLTGREINISRPFEIKDPALEKQTAVEETIRSSIIEEEIEEEIEENLVLDSALEDEERDDPANYEEPVSQQDSGLQTEILGLLKSLNDRLKTTKAERNQMQKQMDAYRTLIEGLENKSEQTEKAYQTLKVQISGREREAEDRAAKAERIALETRQELERTRKLLEGMEEKSKETERTLTELDSAHREQEKVLKKAIETTNRELASTKDTIAQTKQEVSEKSMAFYEGLEQKLKETSARQDSLGAQVDEALTQQASLLQKIDKVTEDRARFMRKIELIEETVLQTRDALVSFKNEADEIGYMRAQLEYESDEQNLPQTLLEHSRVKYEKKAKHKKSFWKRVILSPVWPLSLAFVLGVLVIVWLMSEGPWSLPKVQQNNNTAPAEVISNLPENSGSGILSNIPLLGMSGSAGTAAQENADVFSAANMDEDLSEDADQAAPQTATAEETDLDVAEDVAELTEPVDVSAQADLPEVIKKVEEQALNGLPEAQHDLGAIYVAGHAGVPQDYKKAAYWFEKAANQNIANAAYNLGVLHHQGLGMPADIKEALVWYEKAAKLGHPEAQYNLGIAYIEGVGVNYDAQKAAAYFKEAADQGVMEAAYNLGLIYENGLLGQTRPDDALLWYQAAADKGSEEAKAAIEQLVKRLEIDADEVDEFVDGPAQNVTEQDEPQAAPEDTAARPLAPLSPAENQQVLTRQIQEILVKKGLYPGPADGVFGPLTGDAIRTYQSQYQMPVDGAVSATLLHHMLSNEG